jgi:hypothetical protein
MTLTAPIAEVPANGKIVKVMCAFELFSHLSQEGH